MKTHVYRKVAFCKYLAQSECVHFVFMYCLFACGLFISALFSSGYCIQHGIVGQLVDNALERVWKGVAIAYLWVHS
jgi:thiosulfate reductase cytochrome b subunit